MCVVNATSLIWVTSNLMQIHAFVTELEEQSEIHRMGQQQPTVKKKRTNDSNGITDYNLTPTSTSELLQRVCHQTNGRNLCSVCYAQWNALSFTWICLESSGFLFQIREGARNRRKNQLISTMNVTRPQY